MSNHIWNVPKNLNIEPLSDITLSNHIKEVLFRRGMTSLQVIRNYLEPPPPPLSYKHFPYLDKATLKIIQSIEARQSIAICGDYDTDGMTSTAMLVDVLTRLNGLPVPFIPSRNTDGYGLNISLVNKVARTGIKLLITVDNGVSAVSALNHAKNLGIDVIITDHHKINCKLENFYALIHPSTTPDNSPYRDIAGVGVTYVLAENIATKLNKKNVLNISQDLLCIGTIADMSSLTGANRYWLKKWIKKLHKTECIGLKGLMKNAKISNRQLTSEDIGFKIAPRINSIGRIDDPKLIIDLLLEKDNSELKEKLVKCEEINKSRRFICSSVEKEALKIIKSDKKFNNSFILIAQSHWNNGVIGLVANRIMDKYSRPTAILTSDTEGLFRGSARSPKGFNIVNALKKCSELLEKYGGHSAAAGFTVKASNLIKLESKLQLISNEWLSNSNQPHILQPESYILFKDIDFKLLEEISLLEPFGINNTKPIFWSRGCRIIKSSNGYFGQLILHLSQGGKTMEAIQWNTTLDCKSLPNYIDIVFNIDKKLTKETTVPILNILDINNFTEEVKFKVKNRIYKCSVNDNKSIVIKNEDNKSLNFIINNMNDYNNLKSKNNHYINELLDTSISLLGLNITC